MLLQTFSPILTRYCSVNLLYDPIKKAKGLPWDPLADRRSRRAFRDLVASAYAALDVVAELIALMFTDGIPNLTVGRAQFGSIENWLRKTPNVAGMIVAPKDALLSDLHTALATICGD